MGSGVSFQRRLCVAEEGAINCSKEFHLSSSSRGFCRSFGAVRNASRHRIEVPGDGFLNRSTATVAIELQEIIHGGRTEGRGAYPMTVIRAWDSPAVPGLAPPTAPSGAAMAALAMASASGPSKPQMPTTIWAPRDMILPSSRQQIPPDERAARAYSRQQEQEAAGRRRRWSLERKNASGMRRGPGEDVDFSSKFLRLQAKLGNLAEEGTVSL
ncbi:unnamed protein product [Polarella glacialis]|uniref:Uncharacterized protein n=1 Tax=Polarella glacialis TaxID=89957 RepID=A0A813IT18_POLGL|nr:unnamed protein product [Polarella glacialis]